jgi:Type VI secretion system, TssO
MAQVLNVRERSQSFWKFLLFFGITLVVVVTAVFFDFRMPLVENRKLKEEVDVQRQLTTSQSKFANKLQEVIMWQDSIEKEQRATMVTQLNEELTRKITDLKNLNPFEEQGTTYGKVNKIIVDKLLDIRNLNADIDKLSLELDKKKNDLEKCQESLRNIPVNQTIN